MYTVAPRRKSILYTWLFGHNIHCCHTSYILLHTWRAPYIVESDSIQQQASKFKEPAIMPAKQLPGGVQNNPDRLAMISCSSSPPIVNE